MRTRLPDIHGFEYIAAAFASARSQIVATPLQDALHARPVRHVAMVIQRLRPAFSGQGVQVEQLCRFLAQRGVECSIFTAVAGQPSETETCEGYSVRRIRSDPLPGWGWHNALWMPTFAARAGFELWRRPELDVIHVHALTDALYTASRVARMRRIPIIFEMTLLGADDPMTVMSKRWRLPGRRRATYRGCDAYVAMSGAFLDSYREAGMPEDRLHVIPQGVDTERFRPAERAERVVLRRQLGIPDDGPLLLFIGSLIHRKGIDVLLEAWAEIYADRPDARLLLVGKDQFSSGSPEALFVEKVWRALPEPAARRVVRLGLRDDVETVLRAADLFLFPSRREGFGSVIIEAMATGIPALVAELPGITDWVFETPLGAPGEEPDGVVVPQEAAGALARAAILLLSSPRLAVQIGDAARRRAVHGFDFNRVAQRYIELYRALRAESRR